jgi:pimeloyl-ACP methyl ester carboxylesterase
MKSDIEFKSAGSTLFSTLYKAENEKARVLFIAGGGNVPRKDGHYPALQEEMLERGITSLAFDFRGVGESEGVLNETSLNTRVEDAKAALDFLKQDSTTPIFLSGTSMGAPVAIQMADESIKGILLIVAAAYSLEARDKKFGPEFSEIIRKPESWKGSPDFEKLRQFGGKILHAYGTEDQVIPADISKTYADIVALKGGEVVMLEGIGHKFLKDELNVKARENLRDRMVSFMVEK